MGRRKKFNMSINDLRDLNQKAYNVDPQFQGTTVVSHKPQEGETNIIKTYSGDGEHFYQIVATDCDNSLFGGSYRGMAVAPITKDFPEGDPNQVIIVSAGTNPKDWKNLASAFDE